MIRFTVNGEKLEFDDGKLSNVEALAVKKVTVEHWQPTEFFEAFRTSDVEASTVLVWLAMRRAGSDAKYSEVEFDLPEFWESMESDAESETDDESDPSAPTGEATSS